MSQQDSWGRGEELKATAHHEAGHAVIDIHIGLPVKHVDITREGGDLGGCQGCDPDQSIIIEAASLLKARAEGRPVDPAKITPATRDWIDKMIRSQMAGPLAEMQFRGRPLQGAEVFAVGDDRENMKTLASVRWSDDERANRLRDVGVEVTNLIREPAIWRAIEAVANALLGRGILQGDEVNALYHTAMRG